MIARTLQSDEGSPEMLQPEITPSAPPASEMYHDQASDATIALELQNMENDEHGVRVEKERKGFVERKEKEKLKMKQVCTPVYQSIKLPETVIPTIVTGSIVVLCGYCLLIVLVVSGFDYRIVYLFDQVRFLQYAVACL